MMKLRVLLLPILLLSFFMPIANAKSPMKKKKFENPALQFEGTWQVDSYDFREFEEVPNNINEQLLKEAGAFPIGQRIQFVSAGRSVMPGTFDTATKKFTGLIGETLEMILVQPYVKNLCQGHWDFVCVNRKENYSTEFMIVNVLNWKNGIPVSYADIWSDVKSTQYQLTQLNKNASFDVWFAKSGDMIIPLVIEGRIKGGGEASTMGVRLKRVKD